MRGAARLLAYASVCVCVAGCSQLFLYSVPAAPENQYFNCIERPAAPIADAALAVLSVVGAVVATVHSVNQDAPVDTIGRQIIVTGAIAAGFSWSAWDGARKVSRCRAARRRFR